MKILVNSISQPDDLLMFIFPIEITNPLGHSDREHDERYVPFSLWSLSDGPYCVFTDGVEAWQCDMGGRTYLSCIAS